MPSSTCVSMREFARQVGKSLTWVRNKCHSGELPLIDGKIPLQDGLKKCKAIIKESFRPKQVKKAEEIFDGSDDGDAEILSAVNLDKELKKAILAKEKATAKLKALDVKVRTGELLSVAEVKADARQTAERLRAFCLSAPTRFSGLLENKPQREVEVVLESMFNELLEKIHGGQFSADEEVNDGDLE